MSAMAVLAIVAYATAPVAAKPLLASAYAAARHPVVAGVVKSGAKGAVGKARVTLVFRNSKGKVVATVHPTVDRHGRWHVAIPPGASKVSVSVGSGGRTSTLSEPLKPGRSLDVTAVLPANRTGLLPGLFPY